LANDSVTYSGIAKDFRRVRFQQRYEMLRNEYNLSWRMRHYDLKFFINPYRGFFEGFLPNRGDRRDMYIIDSTPKRAVRTLSALMMAGLTSPARPWFKLGVHDPDLANYPSVKYWLDTVTNRMLYVFSRSNIYQTLHNIYDELSTFGTACAVIFEDYENVLRGQFFTVGEYYLACGPNSYVNTMCRKTWMTVKQLVEAFGIENVSDSVRSAYENNVTDGPGAWREVIHMIEPNDDRISGLPGLKGKPFREVYWELGQNSEKFLSIKGYHEFPVIAPRWDVTNETDVYGKGPGWDALGDCKMLQRMQRDKLMALEKVSNPPLQAHVSMRSESGVNALPGAVSYFSDSSPNAGVKPLYQVQPDLPGMVQALEDVRAAIRSCFYADLILMFTQGELSKEMTAHEVIQRQNEQMLQLGPVIERLEYECLDPLIKRSFNIMMRAGLLPPPPPEMHGVPLDVQYISILAQAQKAVGTVGIEQLASFTGSLAAVFPEVLDAFDAIEAVTQYANNIGTPPKIIRSLDQIAAIQQQKAKQMQQQQMMQNAMAAVQGAKVLSDTPVGQNSALDALLGITGTNNSGGAAGAS